MKLLNSHDQSFINALDQGFFEVMGQSEFENFKSTEPVMDGKAEGVRYLTDLTSFLYRHFERTEANGLAISIGRCSWQFVKKYFEPVLGFQDLEFRLLPPRKRIEVTAHRLTTSVLEPVGFRLAEAHKATHYQWIASLPQKDDDYPASLLAGLFHELLCDLSGGKHYHLQYFPGEVNNQIRIVLKGESPST